MSKNEKVFYLTLEDFENELGRKLTEEEASLIISKFTIYDWSDWVREFLSVHNITRKR